MENQQEEYQPSEDEQTEVLTGEEEEEETKKVPVFMCHELDVNKPQQFRTRAQVAVSMRTVKGDFVGNDDENSEDDEHLKQPKIGKKYQRLYSDELEARAN